MKLFRSRTVFFALVFICTAFAGLVHAEKMTPRERIDHFLEQHGDDCFQSFEGYSAHVRGGYGFFVRMLIVDVSRTDKDYIARVMVHSETGAVDSNASRIPFGEVEAPLTEGEIQKYKDFAARLVKYEAFSLGVTEDGEVHVSLKFDKNPVKLLKLKEGRTPLDVYKMFDERTVREKIGDWYLLYRTDLETGLGETSH